MFGETSGRRKNRRAFLDTLFEAFEEQQIDMDGIAEEVDTFMFEGNSRLTKWYRALGQSVTFPRRL